MRTLEQLKDEFLRGGPAKIEDFFRSIRAETLEAAAGVCDEGVAHISTLIESAYTNIIDRVVHQGRVEVLRQAAQYIRETEIK
jgi:hypothetical protein